MVTALEVFASEAAGTGVLILLGTGVVANVLLPRSKGFGSGWLLISFGWGFAVMAAVVVAYRSGAHINPAVTVGILANGADEYAPGVAITAATTGAYFAGQLLGAIVGAALAYVAFKQHFDEHTDAATKLGVFATSPAIRNRGWNLVTEIIATFALVFVVLAIADTPHQLGPLAVALLVVAIGAGLGGPTGYAINPARDLGPRIVHALLPLKGKGPSDWAYAWVPIVGPLLGGVGGGLLAQAV